MATPKPPKGGNKKGNSNRKNPNPKLSKAAQQRRRDIDNARRRYQRQAERYRKEARTLSGRDAEILEAAANALDQRREDLKGINVRKRLDSETQTLVNESKNFLVSQNRTDWQRGENIGRLRLSGTNEGHRFFALTEQLWAGAPYEDRLDWVRDALAKNPEVLSKYGDNPNANQMIEIVAEVSGIDLDTDTVLSKEYSPAFMRGIQNVVAAYG